MVEAWLDDYGLYIRDGLPVAVDGVERFIFGDVLTPRPTFAEEFWSVVSAYEPDDLYRRQPVSVSVGGTAVRATAFVARSPGKGSPHEATRGWSAVEDPLFGPGLAAVRRLAARHFARVDPMPADMEGFWDAFFIIDVAPGAASLGAGGLR